MEYERKGVTIDWQIENVEIIRMQDKELYSPVISVDILDGTKWKLVVHKIFTSDVWLAIKRETEDNGPEEFRLDYQFALNPHQGSAFNGNRAHSHTFRKNQKCREVNVITPEMEPPDVPDFLWDYSQIRREHILESERFLDLSKDISAMSILKGPVLQTKKHPKKDRSESPDTLMIRCKIWKQHGSIPKSGHFLVRTRMKTENSIFVARVENFSAFSISDRKTLKIVSSPTGEDLMKMDFVLSETYQVPQIELVPIGKPTEKFYKLQVFILDCFGNKTDIGKLEREFVYIPPMTFTLPDVSKEMLLKNRYLGVLEDTLSLQCKLTYCSGKEYEKVEKIEYKMDIVDEAKQTDLSNAVELLTTREGVPCDMKLQTVTEAISAHASVLSSQSPVFEAMFKSKMKETTEKCVHMDDVDAETVKRMLVFLYSDTLEDLEWKDAMKLYIAADKYQILTLKQKCTDFLVQSVDLSNCCVLMHLADMHQDNNLKTYVQDYIAKNRPQVLHCDQWRDFEKNLSQLASEILRHSLVC